MDEPAGALSPDEAGGLRELLVTVLPYPALDGGPDVEDTVAYVRVAIARPGQTQLSAELRRGLAQARGRAADWVAAAAAPGSPDHQLFQELLGWAWDGFLADPRWVVDRAGLGWAHLGWPGPPQDRR